MSLIFLSSSCSFCLISVCSFCCIASLLSVRALISRHEPCDCALLWVDGRGGVGGRRVRSDITRGCGRGHRSALCTCGRLYTRIRTCGLRQGARPRTTPPPG